MRVVWGLCFGGMAAAGACGKAERPVILPPSDGGTSAGAVPGRGGRGGKGSIGQGGAGEGGDNELGGAGASGSSASGGTSAAGGTSGTGGTDMNPPGAPTVTITSPVEVSDPNDEAVLIADNVEVVCTVVKSKDKGATPVTSVTIDMLDGAQEVVDSQPAKATGNPNEYSATFISRKVEENGRIAFICRGSDSSMPPLEGSAEVDSFIDHGPTITPIDPPAPPTEIFELALHDPLQVKFRVDEAPLTTKGDQGAHIGDVSLTVAGVKFDTTEDNGEYTATVHLDGKEFLVVPDGTQRLVIDATNQRAPVPAASEAAYDFIVDGTGPDITIVSPGSGQVVAGNVNLVFKITDLQSGVDMTSVAVTIDTKKYPYDPLDTTQWAYDQGAQTFIFNFDTTQIKHSIAQTTVHVNAIDNVKNKASEREVLLWLDNVPPYVELDPLPLREINGDTFACSLAFDPVGDRAPNDLELVTGFSAFRALVWDETNHEPPPPNPIDQAPDGRASRTDVNSVHLFLQPKVDQGLLWDSNGDGFCDSIEPLDADTGDEIPALQLFPVSPQGASWFGSATNETLADVFPMPDFCTYQGTPTAPDRLCPPTKSSEMRRIIHWGVETQTPAIYGIQPIEGLTCTGDSWEYYSRVSDGWVCLAALAKDTVGNQGVSPPLRLCFDDGVDPPPDCSGPPPSCIIDGCTLLPTFGTRVILP
jgi:hypothetical protein